MQTPTYYNPSYKGSPKRYPLFEKIRARVSGVRYGFFTRIEMSTLVGQSGLRFGVAFHVPAQVYTCEVVRVRRVWAMDFCVDTQLGGQGCRV